MKSLFAAMQDISSAKVTFIFFKVYYEFERKIQMQHKSGTFFHKI